MPTNRLDLSVWTPDFVAISFYKLFGYPTGLGALLARRDALRRLDRPWFAGGTVVAANVGGDLVVPLSGHAGFEDGTVDYLGFPAVEIGLRHVERIGIDADLAARRGPRDVAARRAEPCAPRRRRPGGPFYGPAAWDGRGATIALNFLHPDGRVVDERFVDMLAADHDISVRTGCFCNPGAGEAAFLLSPDALAGVGFGDDMILDDFITRIGMPSGGAVRVSLGLASNFADVHRFMAFATRFRDLEDVPQHLPPRLAC